MIAELKASADLALKHGVKKENIWLDPGIGFVKSRDEDIEVMRHLDQLVKEGYPVLLATSRKRMVKKLIGGDRKSTRLNSSHVSISYAVFCLYTNNVVRYCTYTCNR